jgi:uncharacterized membrane protein
MLPFILKLPGMQAQIDAVLALLAAAKREAVEAEREACATVADNHVEDDGCGGGTDCWRRIAAAIRARGKEQA